MCYAVLPSTSLFIANIVQLKARQDFPTWEWFLRRNIQTEYSCLHNLLPDKRDLRISNRPTASCKKHLKPLPERFCFASHFCHIGSVAVNGFEYFLLYPFLGAIIWFKDTFINLWLQRQISHCYWCYQLQSSVVGLRHFNSYRSERHGEVEKLRNICSLKSYPWRIRRRCFCCL